MLPLTTILTAANPARFEDGKPVSTPATGLSGGESFDQVMARALSPSESAKTTETAETAGIAQPEIVAAVPGKGIQKTTSIPTPRCHVHKVRNGASTQAEAAAGERNNSLVQVSDASDAKMLESDATENISANNEVAVATVTDQTEIPVVVTLKTAMTPVVDAMPTLVQPVQVEEKRATKEKNGTADESSPFPNAVAGTSVPVAVEACKEAENAASVAPTLLNPAALSAPGAGELATSQPMEHLQKSKVKTEKEGDAGKKANASQSIALPEKGLATNDLLNTDSQNPANSLVEGAELQTFGEASVDMPPAEVSVSKPSADSGISILAQVPLQTPGAVAEKTISNTKEKQGITEIIAVPEKKDGHERVGRQKSPVKSDKAVSGESKRDQLQSNSLQETKTSTSILETVVSQGPAKTVADGDESKFDRKVVEPLPQPAIDACMAFNAAAASQILMEAPKAVAEKTISNPTVVPARKETEIHSSQAIASLETNMARVGGRVAQKSDGETVQSSPLLANELRDSDLPETTLQSPAKFAADTNALKADSNLVDSSQQPGNSAFITSNEAVGSQVPTETSESTSQNTIPNPTVVSDRQEPKNYASQAIASLQANVARIGGRVDQKSDGETVQSSPLLANGLRDSDLPETTLQSPAKFAVDGAALPSARPPAENSQQPGNSAFMTAHEVVGSQVPTETSASTSQNTIPNPTVVSNRQEPEIQASQAIASLQANVARIGGHVDQKSDGETVQSSPLPANELRDSGLPETTLQSPAKLAVDGAVLPPTSQPAEDSQQPETSSASDPDASVMMQNSMGTPVPVADKTISNPKAFSNRQGGELHAGHSNVGSQKNEDQIGGHRDKETNTQQKPAVVLDDSSSNDFPANVPQTPASVSPSLTNIPAIPASRAVETAELETNVVPTAYLQQMEATPQANESVTAGPSVSLPVMDQTGRKTDAADPQKVSSLGKQWDSNEWTIPVSGPLAPENSKASNPKAFSEQRVATFGQETAGQSNSPKLETRENDGQGLAEKSQPDSVAVLETPAVDLAGKTFPIPEKTAGDMPAMRMERKAADVPQDKGASATFSRIPEWNTPNTMSARVVPLVETPVASPVVPPVTTPVAMPLADPAGAQAKTAVETFAGLSVTAPVETEETTPVVTPFATPLVAPMTIPNEAERPVQMPAGGMVEPAGTPLVGSVTVPLAQPAGDSRAEAAGTPVAKTVLPMEKHLKLNKVAGQARETEKVLPDDAETAGWENKLPTSDLFGRLASHHAAEATVFGLTANGADRQAAPVQDASVISPAVNLHARAIERTHDMIAVQAMRLTDSKMDSLHVVIKPGAGMQLSLEMRQQGNGIDVQAVLQQGDLGQLGQHWPELQQRLESRGVHLAPLSGGESFITGGGSNGFESSSHESPHPDPLEASAFAAFALAGPVIQPPAPAMAAALTHHGWESWA